jgi:hypothetical protein
MRLLAAVAAAAVVPACGTAIALSYPLNVPFLRAHTDAVVGTRPLEAPEQTTVAQIETGPLRVTCRTTTVARIVETTSIDGFDGVGRVWCGFMAISEGAFAAAIAANMHTGGIVAGSIIGADALGALLYAILASPVLNEHTRTGPGVPETAQTCGDALVVRVRELTWPIARDGSIGGDVKALAAAIAGGDPIAVAGNGLEAAWIADAGERCSVDAQFGLDDPAGTCTPAAAPVATIATPHAPLEIKIRIPLAFTRSRRDR